MHVVKTRPIKRREFKRRVLPLTQRHEAVLQHVGDEPRGAAQIAAILDLTAPQVTSALYALQSRGLAMHLPGRAGWIRM